MKRYLMFFLGFILLLSFSACEKSNKEISSNSVSDDYYIKVGDDDLPKTYIGYFFYVAQETMLSEAGWNSENSTPEDIKTYWETTQIDGVDAVDAARDIAAKNAVEQKIKYFKALSEGIKLSDDEIKVLDKDIEDITTQNGGKDAFSKLLSSKGTDLESYRQILIELECINRLYDKYYNDGSLLITNEELQEFYEKNIDKYSSSEIDDRAYQSKFNEMAKIWEKDYVIDINDSKMKDFTINYN